MAHLSPSLSHRLFYGLWALLVALPLFAEAQSIGIGTTAPDASAALDIVAADKGALLPRLTLAQRTAIPTPAAGLLVFQTDGAVGFYYNAGTAAIPVWQQIGTTTAADNLGNHTATQSLNLGANRLVGNGGTNGLHISATGLVGLGTVTNPGGGFAQLGNTSINTAGAEGNGGNVSGGVGSLTWTLGVNGYTGLFYNSNTGPNGNGLAVKVNGTSNNATALDVSKGAQTVAGTSLFVVKASGNVGIGVVAPTKRLDVVGEFQTTVANGFFTTYNLAPSGGKVLLAELAATGGNGPQIRFTGAGTGFMDIGENANGDFVVEGTDAARLVVQNAGNVGIGTATPTGRLEVSNGFVGLQIRPGEYWNGGAFVTNNNFTTLEMSGTKTLNVADNFTVTGGSVGIGTNSPSQKLEVDGQVFSTTGGFRFPDNTVQTTAAPAPAAPGSLPARLASGQSGTATIGSGTTGVNAFTITFPSAFATAPQQVLVTVRTEDGQAYTETFSVTTKNITATGFDLNILRTDAPAAWTQNLLLDWMAF